MLDISVYSYLRQQRQLKGNILCQLSTLHKPAERNLDPFAWQLFCIEGNYNDEGIHGTNEVFGEEQHRKDSRLITLNWCDTF